MPFAEGDAVEFRAAFGTTVATWLPCKVLKVIPIPSHGDLYFLEYHLESMEPGEDGSKYVKQRSTIPMHDSFVRAPRASDSALPSKGFQTHVNIDLPTG
jgi:hypothetical protein